MAAKLYDKKPLPKASSAVGSVIDRRSEELFTVSGVTTAQQEELRNTFRQIEGTGLPDGLVARLADAFIDGHLATARAKDPEAWKKECEGRILSGNQACRQQLRDTYGPLEGERMVERVSSRRPTRHLLACSDSMALGHGLSLWRTLPRTSSAPAITETVGRVHSGCGGRRSISPADMAAIHASISVITCRSPQSAPHGELCESRHVRAADCRYRQKI